MSYVSRWLRNARSVSVPQSLMPAVLASVLAIGSEGWSFFLSVLACLGVVCAHMALNLADDYFDYQMDMLSDREKVIRQGFRAVMVKYPYLTSGEESLKSLRRAIVAFLGVSLACGLVIFVTRTLQNGFTGAQGSWWIVLVVALTGLLGVFYSAPPLKLAFRGLGELVIGLIFGPLLMVGVYYAASGALRPEIFWISVPVGVLVLNILFTHSFIERASDAGSGKLTLALLLKYNTLNLVAACLFNLLPLVSIVLAVCLGALSPAYLAILLVSPASIWLCHSLYRFNEGLTEVAESPAFFLGPMPNWPAIREAGMDWFMMRWLTARNVLAGFCVIIIIVKLVLLIFS